jgi:hypothetical protein
MALCKNSPGQDLTKDYHFDDNLVMMDRDNEWIPVDEVKAVTGFISKRIIQRTDFQLQLFLVRTTSKTINHSFQNVMCLFLSPWR